MNGETIEMSTANFNEVIENNDIVLLDFWADWCGPCKMFGPIFEKAAKDNPDLAFGKVDTEAQQELAAQFGISSIPTLGIFREKILLFLQPGMLPENALKDIIQQVKDLDMEEVRKKVAEQQAAKADGKVQTN
ncbi:MAG: thioredoxin [Deltaproteobacteria bacterium]|nr:thioredoxin [Deltaproteobacteria bacterium]